MREVHMSSCIELKKNDEGRLCFALKGNNGDTLKALSVKISILYNTTVSTTHFTTDKYLTMVNIFSTCKLLIIRSSQLVQCLILPIVWKLPLLHQDLKATAHQFKALSKALIFYKNNDMPALYNRAGIFVSIPNKYQLLTRATPLTKA